MVYNDVMVRLTVRLPDEIHSALIDAAHSGDRSLNQQIIRYLREVMHSEQDHLDEEEKKMKSSHSPPN